MQPDDLPVYPTPQQATYVVPPQLQPARRPQKPHNAGLPAQPTPAQYSQASYSQRPYQQQYQLPQPPHQQHQQHQPQHQLHQPQYQPQPQHQPQQYQQLYAPSYANSQYQGQSYYQNQPQYTPPVQAALPSYSTGQYGSPQYAASPMGGGQYQPPPSGRTGLQSQPTQPQYAPPPPLQASVVPQQSPPRQQQQAPAKKPPANRSRESFEEPKVSNKQRLESELRLTFEKVDKNRSGRISARELSSALMNFDNTRFQDLTVLLMIKLFTTSTSPSGLNFEQFVSLWKYLTAYKKLFVAADVNRLGDISFGEFQRIIEQIGYKLNVDLVLHLFQKFANKEILDTSSAMVSKLKFDAFIELLVYLRKLTDIFKQYDKDLSGVATINYLDFLLEISNLT